MENNSKRKSGLNILAGITDIILAIISLMSLPAIIGQAFIDDGDPLSSAIGFIIFMLIGLVIHIIALVKNKKLGISIVGHVLGIVGTGIFALFGAIMSLPSFILLVLACIFSFIQKNVVSDTQNNNTNINQ